MIERHWKGTAKPGEAGNYKEHLLQATFPKLRAIEGFIKASILTREVDNGTEFLIVTVWSSLEVIWQFAGADISVAVVPDNVMQMMTAYDAHVVHYEVADAFTK